VALPNLCRQRNNGGEAAKTRILTKKSHTLGSDYQETGGAPQIYGKQYYLTEASGWKECQTKKNISRKYLTSLMLRSKAEFATLDR
jgi:hypothetical protein